MSINNSIKSHSDLDHVVKQALSENAELFEYQAAQDFALHADTIGWQISSILISAVLVAFGVIVSRNPESNDYIFGIILLINIVLSIWILIFLGQNQMMLLKLYRVREIEKKFKLKQNYFWELEQNRKKQGIYRTYRISGVLLIKYLFGVLVLSSVVYGLIEFSNSNVFSFINLILLELSIVIPIIAIIIGCFQEKEFRDYLDYLSKNS